MNYLKVYNLLEGAAKYLGVEQFVFIERPDGTKEQDYPFPIIELGGIRTTQSGADLIDGNYSHNVVLFFWEKASIQDTPEEMQEQIDKMWILSESFIDILLDNVKIRIENVNKTPEPPNARRYGGKTVGVGLSFTLITKKGC
jgi:hypothetical protein